MSGTPKIKQPSDVTTVNTGEECEVNYWCRRFDCNKKELINAVKSVGNLSEKIELFLYMERITKKFSEG